jgi:hypothetical protein
MFENIGLPKQSAKSRKANEKIWECIEQMPKEGDELVWSEEFGSWLSHVSADGVRRFSYLGCIGNMSDVSAWCREHGLKFSVGRIYPFSRTKKLDPSLKAPLRGGLSVVAGNKACAPLASLQG